MVTDEGKPPLCKGRWIAKQDGGIVRKGVAMCGMVSGRSKPLPYGVCIAQDDRCGLRANTVRPYGVFCSFVGEVSDEGYTFSCGEGGPR